VSILSWTISSTIKFEDKPFSDKQQRPVQAISKIQEVPPWYAQLEGRSHGEGSAALPLLQFSWDHVFFTRLILVENCRELWLESSE